MDTKLKSDIAESVVSTELLKRGFHVLCPIGDRLPYDLCIDRNGKLIRLQVKRAWLRKRVYIVDSRRTKTNRRRMVRSRYRTSDFDYAVLYIQDHDIFYIMPNKEFCSYRSEITLSENNSRQRRPRSACYREAWGLLK